MNTSLLATLGLGFGLGLKHALDADHLVAISTIVGRERSVWRSSLVGTVWGLGHTASLFMAAVAVIVLRVSISPAMAQSMEFCVGVMLMILGADLVRRLLRGEIQLHSHTHEHDGESHAHLHLHAYATVDDHLHHTVGRRPFFVGVVHGLAGSAALTLFVLSTIESAWMAILYVLVFGAGTVAGMFIMSTLIGLPFALASRRLSGAVQCLQLAIGVGSFAFGIFYAGQVAFGEHWLTQLLP
ncbi:MAG TPA: urease accessory protein UreH [Candidatus Margulisiibacteriota bacterium]|nr:urease accessory protein UreH [Candidatus Margulisiibacteriota bacterium]